jgi:hypothetical protein
VYNPGLIPQNSTFKFGASKSGTVLLAAANTSAFVGLRRSTATSYA